MKKTLFTLVLLAAASAAVAQSRTNDHNLTTNNSQRPKTGIVTLAPVTTEAPPMPTNDYGAVTGIVTLAPVTTEASAETKRPRVSYSGPLVPVAKTKNPLELFNPWAPTESYGGESRVSHDLLTGRPNGVKLLTIKF